MQSKYNNDFYQLVNFYQPQVNPLYCSVASSVIILNALNYNNIESQKDAQIVKPSDTQGKKILEYKIYNQTSFLNSATDKIKNKDTIEYKQKNKSGSYDAGLSLSDLAEILSKSYNLKVEKIHAENNDIESIEKFRAKLKWHLSDKTHYILINFKGSDIDLNTGGHISPVAAYDQETDSVMILDVALHKDLWHFVPLERLYKAMNSKDGDNYRGYLIVSK